MSQLFEFQAVVQEATESTMVARLVPFGEKVSYGAGTVRFEADSITVGDKVPLTIDHGTSVSDRIGVMTSHFSDPSGLYGEFQISDTPKGQEIRTLLQDGAVTDVSVGVLVESADHGKDSVQRGSLDHVSIVVHGRFADASVENPSKVLQVHEVKEPKVAEVKEAAAPVVTEYDDTELQKSLVGFKTEIVRLADELDTVKADQPKTAEFSGEDIFSGMLAMRAGVKLENHALADVIGDLGAADASGIVPDAYWAAGLQHKIDRRRPMFATGGAAPFPASGNNLLLPRVTQETIVTKRTAEKGAAGSQALQASEISFPIQWFSGAVDISLEIIAQSDPSVVRVVMDSLLQAYAEVTELDANTLLTAAATHTGAALTTATYAGLVGDIITTSDLIEDATGAPGNILAVTSAQWIAILSLSDAEDRRQFSMMSPQNADGTSTLTTRGIDVGGVFIFRAPDATFAAQYNTDSYKNAEKSPMQVAATNVELMGRDIGVLGATVNVFWPVGLYTYEV